MTPLASFQTFKSCVEEVLQFLHIKEVEPQPLATLEIDTYPAARVNAIVLPKSGVSIITTGEDVVDRWNCDFGSERPSDGLFIGAYPLSSQGEANASQLANLLKPDLFPEPDMVPIGSAIISGRARKMRDQTPKQQQATTSIDGGNRNFVEIDGKKMLFIGFTSLCLSLEALREQGLLNTHHIVEHMQTTDLPPERVDRLSQAAQLLGVDQTIANNDQSSRCHFTKSAIDLTKEIICKEMGNPNLVILEHGSLHIDLEHAVAGRMVFLHNPALGPQPTEAWEQKHQDNFKSLSIAYANNKKLIDSLGFEAVDVPGLARGNAFSEDYGGWFLNGLMFRDIVTEAFTFLSTAMPPECEDDERAAQELFFDRLRGRGVRVGFVEPGPQRGGGLHCLTNVRRSQESWNRYPHGTIPARTDQFARTILTTVTLEFSLGDDQELSIGTDFAQDSAITTTEWFNEREFYLPVPWEGGQFWFTNSPKIKHRILPGQRRVFVSSSANRPRSLPKQSGLAAPALQQTN